MRDLTAVCLHESIILINCTICSTMRSMISLWVKIFLSLFIPFRKNVRMSMIPFPCLLFLALHQEWSLNTSADKRSNAVCIFANLWFKLSIFHGLVLFSVGIYKRRRKKLTGKKINIDRQFFKSVFFDATPV